jgi:hypothetical protein
MTTIFCVPGESIGNCTLTLDWDYSYELEMSEMSNALEWTAKYTYQNEDVLFYDQHWRRSGKVGVCDSSPCYLAACAEF